MGGKLKKSIYDTLSRDQQAEVTRAGVRVYDDSLTSPRYMEQRPQDTLKFDNQPPLGSDVAYSRPAPVEISPQQVGVPVSSTYPDNPEGMLGTARAAGGMAGAAAGAALAPATGGLAIPASLLLQGLGSATGDYIAQQAFQTDKTKPSIADAARVGAIDTGLGALAHGLGFALGRGGGVPRESIREAALRPDEILNPLGGDEYHDLGSNIADDLNYRKAKVVTKGRQKLEGMIAANADKKMDPRVIAKALEDAKIGYARPEVQAVDSALQGHADRLVERVTGMVPKETVNEVEQVPMKILDESGKPYTKLVNKPVEIPRYEVSPKDYDTLTQQEMTAALKKYYEQHGGKLYHRALAKARSNVTGYLYDTLGEGAAQAGKQANRELNIRERVQRLIAKTEAQAVTTGPQKLHDATIMSNVGTGVEIRKSLQAYDRQEGTKWWDTLKDLSMREHWSPLDSQAAGEIAAFALATSYRNRNVLQRSAVFLGKQAIKLGVPAAKVRAVGGLVAAHPINSAAGAYSTIVPSRQDAVSEEDK